MRMAARGGRAMDFTSVARTVAVTLIALAATHDALAQTAKVYRIGFLGYGNGESTASHPAVADFRQGLRDNGYVEGRNVVVDYRHGDAGQMPELAAALVRGTVDVIVASGEPAVFAAKRATRTIPIVVTEFAGDPVRSGLAASLARPDGNLTGLATQSEELWPKRLAVLQQITPKLTRLAVLWNPANPANAACVSEIRAAAASMGMQSRAVDVVDAKSLDAALAALVKEPPDALVPCWDAALLARAKAIADYALKLRVPTLAPVRDYVDAGALLSIGTSLQAQRRRSAYYVDKILKGAKPGDLPIERPVQFDLVINASTAKSLGVAVPPTLMVLADDIVQ
jgi:putative ABC transport system substrate-binding protein